MSLPEPYNTRAKDMWKCIEKHIDFTGKSVIDVGCGRGDLSMMAWVSGARVVYGIDNSKIELREAWLRSYHMRKEGAKLYFMHKDIEQWDEEWPGYSDIAICTSALPYLVDPNRALANMQRDCGIAIIECQYSGDGPGFETIKNDEDMKDWLLDFGWTMVDKIGETKIECRNTKRSIWRCANE